MDSNVMINGTKLGAAAKLCIHRPKPKIQKIQASSKITNRYIMPNEAQSPPKTRFSIITKTYHHQLKEHWKHRAHQKNTTINIQSTKCTSAPKHKHNNQHPKEKARQWLYQKQKTHLEHHLIYQPKQNLNHKPHQKHTLHQTNNIWSTKCTKNNML